MACLNCKYFGVADDQHGVKCEQGKADVQRAWFFRNAGKWIEQCDTLPCYVAHPDGPMCKRIAAFLSETTMQAEVDLRVTNPYNKPPELKFIHPIQFN